MAIEILRLHHEFHVTFATNYHIYTTVTDNPAVISRWISRTVTDNPSQQSHLNHLIVGLAVKWPPSPTPRAATLHLCVGSRCLIIQLARLPPPPAGVPNSLIDFLNNRHYTFVGVDIHNELTKLHHDYRFGPPPIAAVDLRHFAAEKFKTENLRRADMKRLTRNYMREKYTKPPPEVDQSKWDDEELTYDQIKYASVDAFIYFQIGVNIKAYKRRRY